MIEIIAVLQVPFTMASLIMAIKCILKKIEEYNQFKKEALDARKINKRKSDNQRLWNLQKAASKGKKKIKLMNVGAV